MSGVPSNRGGLLDGELVISAQRARIGHAPILVKNAPVTPRTRTGAVVRLRRERSA